VSQQLFKACLLVGPLCPNDERLAQIHRTGIPYLALGRLDAMPECSSATVDYVTGAYLEPAPKSRFLALLRRNVATHLPRI